MNKRVPANTPFQRLIIIAQNERAKIIRKEREERKKLLKYYTRIMKYSIVSPQKTIMISNPILKASSFM